MADNKLFKIALIQMACCSNQKDNIAKAVSRIEEASKNEAKVVCLPELFKSRYFCQTEDPDNFDFAEAIPGITTKKFSKLGKKL